MSKRKKAISDREFLTKAQGISLDINDFLVEALENKSAVAIDFLFQQIEPYFYPMRDALFCDDPKECLGMIEENTDLFRDWE